MVDDRTERVLHVMFVPELVAIAVLFALLSRSLFGGGTFMAGVSRPVRLAAWVVLGSDLLAPALVYLDMRYRGAEVSYVWIHAVAIPVVNLVGIAAYLEERKRHEAD